MILKRKETEKEIKVIYKSSNILGSTYLSESGDLTLIFNKGNRYKYPKVSKTDYARFEMADSQGKVFNTHIKPYAFEKLDSVDPDSIITEIDSLYNTELLNKQILIKEALDTTTLLAKGDLEKIKVKLDELITEVS